MIYKKLYKIERKVGDSEKWVYARIDDDGKCRLTCTEDHPPFQEWLAEGNEPEPADE